MITSGLHQMKLCSRCKEEKELTKFYKRIVSKDGLTASCRDCLGKNVQKNMSTTKKLYVVQGVVQQIIAY